MKTVFVILILLIFSGFLFSQNPITPAGIYLADPSAKVWNDGHLYIYGSLDESCEYYCSRRHHVMQTADMKNWIVFEDVFSSEGKNDEVDYNDELLYAPDCGFRNDTFFLYYCQPSRDQAEGVAFSDKPYGPFVAGKAMNTGEYQEIDPSVFMDDDGQAYYIWGQFSLKMARLKPGMNGIDGSTLRNGILTEEEHHFHEGAYMTKRNGIYYLVYADISRGEMPTCIGYATSSSPFGPYKYGGVIIDNDECNPGNWNNHGSIAEFKGQWYVFYHRSTHGCNMMRKACVEPIYFGPDGSIPEVEMTSQGAAEPFRKGEKIEAEQACILHGNVRIMAFSGNEEELGMICDEDRAVYRYIEFTGAEKEIEIRLKAGRNGGTISAKLDKPWHQRIAEIEVQGSEGGGEWQTLSFKIEPADGIHAVYLEFYGDGEDLMEVDWFRFN